MLNDLKDLELTLVSHGDDTSANTIKLAIAEIEHLRSYIGKHVVTSNGFTTVTFPIKRYTLDAKGRIIKMEIRYEE